MVTLPTARFSAAPRWADVVGAELIGVAYARTGGFCGVPWLLYS